MKKVIFIILSANNSHSRNRIVDFIEHGYDVEVYGFTRTNQTKAVSLPYTVTILGTLTDKHYLGRIRLYIDGFLEFRGKYDPNDVVFYLEGLDVAMFFHSINPMYKFIYEEYDLTHTYTRIKHVLEIIDKWIIKKSLITVTTSEGFIKFHFGAIKPNNVFLLENKLIPDIINHQIKKRKKFDKNHISIGFVGGPRFESVYNFIDVYCRNFPHHVFHIFGGPVPANFETLRKYNNCIFHSFFKNPDDLPEIYDKIDLVLSTYDVKFENVRYAEPNKLYESIFFETPIIVSSNTFLAEKVQRLKIGYDINAMDENTIVKFIEQLNENSILELANNARKIDKQYTLNINTEFFSKLKEILYL